MEHSGKSDEFYMRAALAEAQKALSENEVPVGAVIVAKDQIIARSYNMTEKLNDVTAHAEMLAFTSASNHLGGKYLKECTLYVTLEPCIMCAGASYWSQIGRIVYGASDPKRGFLNQCGGILHPKTLIEGNVLNNECSELLISFFKRKR